MLFDALAICGGNLIADVKPQSLSTPFYPNRYGKGLYCNWLIKTPLNHHIIFLEFSDFILQNEEFVVSNSNNANQALQQTYHFITGCIELLCNMHILLYC